MKLHDLGLQKQIERLRMKWPQAHCEPLQPGFSDDGRQLIIIPGMLLSKGWTHNICTALFKIRLWGDKLGEPLNGFFVDLPDLRLADKSHPHYSRNDDVCVGEIEDYLGRRYRGYEDADDFFSAALMEKIRSTRKRHWIAGHPQWYGLTRFWWRAQAFNPNYDTLFTAAMLVRQRLNIAC